MDARLHHHQYPLEVFAEEDVFRHRLGAALLVGGCSAIVSEEIGRQWRVAGTTIDERHIEQTNGAHGPGQKCHTIYRADRMGLRLHHEIAVHDDRPFIALRVGIENRGNQPVHVHSLSPLSTTLLEFGQRPLDGWVNGYHSWSFTGFVPHSQRQPRSPLRWISRYFESNVTTPRPRLAGQYVGEEVAALIDGDSHSALVAGFMGVLDQFGQVYLDGRTERKSLALTGSLDGIQLRPDELQWGEWALLYVTEGDHPDPLGIYADAVTRLSPGRCPQEPPRPGWSSWYQFFDHVTIEDMQRNQSSLMLLRDRLPLSVIQLDDGYQPAWGDWLQTNDRFPAGVAQWAQDVRSDGFTPGLWLSPFAVDARSSVFREHPDWLIRDEKGRQVKTGLLYDHWLYGLDLTHPGVKEHLSYTISTIVHDWKIPYLKLDFLLCGAMAGRYHDPNRTRAQALREGLRIIREKAGEEATLVGCGCPFGPALGIVDIMRVGPDVAPNWYPRLFGATLKRDSQLPATRNAIRNSLHRAWTHRWWWLDADNVLARAAQHMTAAEVQTLTTVIGMTSSHMVISDDLNTLGDERLRWATALLPLADGQLNMSFLFDEQQPSTLVQDRRGVSGPFKLMALINWDDHPADREVCLSDVGFASGEPVLACDFWNHCADVINGDKLTCQNIPPHGVALHALRSQTGTAQFAGSTLHLSMGGEITRWQADRRGVDFTISLNRKSAGQVWLYLPHDPQHVTVNRQPSELRPIGANHLHELDLTVDGEAQIRIEF